MFPSNNVNSKTKFLEMMHQVCTQLAWASRQIQDMSDTYVDRNYGTTNPFTTEELSAAGMDAAQLAAFVNLAIQLPKFMNNQAPTPADHSIVVNQLRTDI